MEKETVLDHFGKVSSRLCPELQSRGRGKQPRSLRAGRRQSGAHQAAPWPHPAPACHAGTRLPNGGVQEPSSPCCFPEPLQDAQNNISGVCNSPGAESSACNACIRHAGEVELFAARSGEGGRGGRRVPTHDQQEVSAARLSLCDCPAGLPRTEWRRGQSLPKLGSRVCILKGYGQKKAWMHSGADSLVSSACKEVTVNP